MKIKIGNFNFLNNEENKLTSYKDFTYKMDYFYLDGKEKTLFVNSGYSFSKIFNNENPYNKYKFEQELINKFGKTNIIDYNKLISFEVNDFLKKKAVEMYENKEYSRYDLYNNISLDKIISNKLNLDYVLDTSEEIDFDTNRIIRDGFEFNPYTCEIENLEEKLEENTYHKMTDVINKNIIQMEIENGEAPDFVYEILKINDYFEDKKTVNVNVEGVESFKAEARIYQILNFRDNKFELNLGYNTTFEKNNPNISYEDRWKLEKEPEKLKSISYSKNVLEIDSSKLKDIEKQIIKTPRDAFLFKLDKMKDENENTFYKYREELSNKHIYMPSNIQYVLSEITGITLRNEQRKAGNLDGELEEMPEWYSEELERIFEDYDVVEGLKQAETLEELEEIAKKTGDNELINIVNWTKDEMQIDEEQEDEM